MEKQEIREHLARVLSSQPFAGSERMKRFLRFTVEEALAGRGGDLKESVIGVGVFDRPTDYDPRVDPIVRVEARRLRSKLEQFYAAQGASERFRIEYLRGGYAPVFRHAGTALETARTKTIAILPFSNLTSQPDRDFFSDGLTQELIHILTRLPGLRVMAWNSAVELQTRGQKPEQIGRSLPVDHVLEGSIRSSGDRLRITTRLVETKTGLYVWAETFDRRLRDLFAVQEELARAIAEALQIRLSGDSLRLRPAGVSVDAYSLYLQGRHAWGRRTEEGLRQSIALFERALEIDPRCALAYAGLADSYCLLGDFGLAPTATVVPRAREAARNAIALDREMAEAYNSLGFLLSRHDWDWAGGEEHYRKALALNPGYATARHWYGVDLLVVLGRVDEASAEMSMACELSPLDPVVIESANYVLMLARRYAEAEQGYRRLMEFAPGFHKSYTGFGRVLIGLGRFQEAIEMFERGRQIVGDTPSILGALAQAYGWSGNRSEARRIRSHLADLGARRHVSDITFAIANIAAGDFSEALDCLERAADHRDMSLTAAAMHPAYDDLRNDARFRRLLARMNLEHVSPF